MKKTINLMLAMAALFLSASCQKEALTHDLDKADAVVTFNVNIPEGIQTKAISDGTTAKNLSYEVWYGEELIEKSYKEIKLVGLKATLEFRVVRGLEYTFVFWADSETSPYTWHNLKSINMEYGSANNGNSEDRDAFFGNIKISLPDDADANNNNYTVTLTRPFAQLNFVSTDYTNGMTINGTTISTIELVNSTINLNKVAQTFDASNGETDTVGSTAQFTANSLVNQTFDDGTKGTWISMNYILPIKGTDTIGVTADFTLNIKTEDNETLSVNPTTLKFNTGVPVKTNFRTNIIGNLFTEGGAITVNVDPALLGDNNVTVD